MIAIYISSDFHQYLTLRKTYAQARDQVIKDIIKNNDLEHRLYDLYITDRNGDPLTLLEESFNISIEKERAK